jgi:hypothetical protein
MSIKRIPPEAIETFTLQLHPKRTYSARRIVAVSSVPPVVANVLLTESGLNLITEGSENILLE